MEESRWHNSAEAYRAVQALVRDGRYQEAVERAQRVLLDGGLGRKHAARLHSQICWLYVEQMQRVCPAAVLHGEEAVRLAELVKDQWIRTEAFFRLTHAYCRLGDLTRARHACGEVARELEQNEAALAGGPPALLQLEATLAEAAGDEDGCLTSLVLAEELSLGFAPAVRARIFLQHALCLLAFGRWRAAAELLAEHGRGAAGGPDAQLEWELAHSWLEVATQPGPATDLKVRGLLEHAAAASHAVVMIHALALQALLAAHSEAGEAARLARLALDRCHVTGRVDLSRSLRRRLAHLLA
ncbi:MAG TPA: hypothetical protein VNT75_15660 [Symbiobacteriaceae bacterium]|nr:hypothetical protein [Symbiobacteriaceae bacterium]